MVWLDERSANASLAREINDRHRIGGAVVSLANVERIVDFTVSEFDRLESNRSASIAGRKPLDADEVRHGKIPANSGSEIATIDGDPGVEIAGRPLRTGEALCAGLKGQA
jgi:hypothetical protein